MYLGDGRGGDTARSAHPHRNKIGALLSSDLETLNPEP